MVESGRSGWEWSERGRGSDDGDEGCVKKGSEKKEGIKKE